LPRTVKVSWSGSQFLMMRSAEEKDGGAFRM
jgi:hypothetical protein